jgi:hypothetical protein
VDEAAASTSKSAVSRRFVAATETALGELVSRRLDDLDLVAFMVDGVHFGEHTCVVALGIAHGPCRPLTAPAASYKFSMRQLKLEQPAKPHSCFPTQRWRRLLASSSCLESSQKRR